MKLFSALSRSGRTKPRHQRQAVVRRKRLLRAEALEDRRLLAAELEIADSGIVQIRLEVTDTSGAPVAAVEVGDAFQLHAFVEDLRFAPDGVFAAYLDVTYTALASVDGPITYGPNYPFLHSGDASVPGMIDELGAVDGFSFLGGGEFLLATVPFTATSPGTVSFTADPADLGGHEVLLYGSNDPVPTSSIDYGSASLTIGGQVNAPPEAINDNFEVDEDSALIANADDPTDAVGVLDNDSDPDGDSLMATSIVAGPFNGTVTLDGDGSFQYVPDPDFHGQDSFVYEVSDGNGGTDEATVNITVHSVIDAAIDVKPGSDDNPINLGSKGVVPIAILSTQQANGAIDDFNAQTLDPNLDTFFLNGVEIDPVHAAFEDVDGDGDLDLLLHFSMEDLVNEGVVDEDSTDLVLSAEYGGAALAHDLGGSDSVRTIVPKGKANSNGNGNGYGN